ncbi:MAG: hypothetical protein LBG72_07935 [Spirochaetaceae bacterium]|jgi:hypothetical protein|nr:hypothetical protein [Spirochaetaceae bacterium]
MEKISFGKKSAYGRILAAAIAAFGVWFAACQSPVGPSSSNAKLNAAVANADSVRILNFSLKTKGNAEHPSLLAIQGGTKIIEMNISSSPVVLSGTVEATASQAMLNAGKNSMSATDISGESDTYESLIPVVTSTAGTLILPLTERYLNYAFPSRDVYEGVLNWANGLKSTSAENGMGATLILEYIRQQKTKFANGGPDFMPPLDDEGKLLEYAVDFTSPVDFLVLAPDLTTVRRYKVSITAYTSIPIYVNAENGNDGNTGLEWANAFKTLKQALDTANQNSRTDIPKEIYLAGSSDNRPVYYDLNGFIPVNDGTAETAKITPPEGGIRIKGGFQGIETAAGQNPSDAAKWPTFVYNSKSASNGNVTLDIQGVPFELETVTLTGAAVALGTDKILDTTTIATDITAANAGNEGVGGNQVVRIRRDPEGRTTTVGKLTLRAQGRVTGGDTGNNGGGVSVTESGILDMYGGEIAGNKGANGGGVFIDWGTMNIYSGRVAGNEATGSSGSIGGSGVYGGGGGIFITAQAQDKKAVVNFTAGSITGNYASAGSGGGVFIDADGSSEKRGAFYMGIGSSTINAGTRPEISGNIAAKKGGGVFYIKGASDTTSAILKKMGDNDGAPSGIIRALDDGVPPLSSGIPVKAANLYPQCLSNIAIGDDGDIDPQPIPQGGGDIWNKDDGHAIGNNDISPLSNGSDTLGSYINFDSSNLTGSTNAEGKISEFKVTYIPESRELNVSISHPAAGKAGKITVWVPADVIDSYRDAAGTIVANITKTEVQSSSGSILMQIPDDIRNQVDASPLGQLLPTNKGVFASTSQRAYSDIIPIKTAGRGTPQYPSSIDDTLAGSGGFKEAIEALFNTEGPTFNISAASSAFSDAAYRTSTNSNTIVAGEAGNTMPPPFDYGNAPILVVIYPNANANVYYIDVKLETGIPLFVDENGDDGNDGRSWQKAKKTIKGAIAAAPAYTPTEIWVQKETPEETLAPITPGVPLIAGNKRITIIGGFNGSELTKTQRGTVTNNTVKFAFDTSNGIVAGAQVTVEYAEIYNNPIELPSGSAFTLGEGAKITGVGITATNSQVVLNSNAQMTGSSGVTGIKMTGGSLIMNGLSQISGYGKGGVALSGASMIMNDSAKVLQNSIEHSTNPSITGATPISAGVTLLNSSSLIMNALTEAYEPDPTSADYYPYNDPPQIRQNTMTITGGPFTSAPGGGGIYAKNSTITLENSTSYAGGRIYNNRVTNGNGGGVYLDSGARLIFKKGEINGNSVTGTADGIGDGGGVYLGGPNDTGPGKFVNGSTANLTSPQIIQSANQNYNNGVVLDMSDAAGITNLSLVADRTPSAVIAGNTAQKRGGGVFISAGAELYKFGSRTAVNTKGVIFGSSFGADGSLVNSASAGGAAIYDMNATFQTTDNYNHGLFLKSVDVNVWGIGNGGTGGATDSSPGTAVSASGTTGSLAQGNAGNYPPDMNQADGNESLKYSSYYQQNAPSKNSKIAEFRFEKGAGDYTASITDYDSTRTGGANYTHRGDTNGADGHAAASGEIKIRLPLSAVQEGGGAPFTVIIKPAAMSNVVSDEYGAKIILPLDTYRNPSNNDRIAAHALSGIFPGARTFDIDGDAGASPPTDYSSSASAAVTAQIAMNYFDSHQTESPDPSLNANIAARMKIIQSQADNPENPLAYGEPDFSTVYTTTTTPNGKMTGLYKSQYGSGASILEVGPGTDHTLAPKFTFAATAQINTYYLYCVSESGNVRMYRLVVDVYTALPKYVNTTAATGDYWGQDRGTNLSTAIAFATTATTSQDIWVKETVSSGNTAWADNTARVFSGSPVTIIGGFRGDEVAPEARPAYPGETTTIYAHDPDSAGYTKATYNDPLDASGPRDGTVKAYTKGPNNTKIALGKTTVKEGTVITFRDIDVSFGNNNLIIDGGQVVLENAQFEFSGASGNIVITNGGLLKVQDADYTKAKRESRIKFTGAGQIIVGTAKSAGAYGTTGGDYSVGQGKFDLYAGIVESTTRTNPVIIVGDYATLTSMMDTSGSRLRLSAETALANNKAEVNAGAIKTAGVSGADGLIKVNEDASFLMYGGVVDGSGGGATASVLVAGHKANTTLAAPKYGTFQIRGGSIKGFGGTGGIGVKLQVHAVFNKAASATIYGVSDIATTNVFGNKVAIEDGTLEGTATGLTVPNNLARYDTTAVGVNATNGKATWDQTFGQGTTFETTSKAKFAYLLKQTVAASSADKYILLALQSSGTDTKAKFSSSGVIATSPKSFKVYGLGLTGQDSEIGTPELLLDTSSTINSTRVVIPVNTVLSTGTAAGNIDVVVNSAAIDTQEYMSTWATAPVPSATYAAYAKLTTGDGDDEYLYIPAGSGTSFTAASVQNPTNSLLLGQDATRVATTGGAAVNTSDIVLKTSAKLTAVSTSAPVYLFFNKSAITAGNALGTVESYCGFTDAIATTAEEKYLYVKLSAGTISAASPAAAGFKVLASVGTVPTATYTRIGSANDGLSISLGSAETMGRNLYLLIKRSVVSGTPITVGTKTAYYLYTNGNIATAPTTGVAATVSSTGWVVQGTITAANVQFLKPDGTAGTVTRQSDTEIRCAGTNTGMWYLFVKKALFSTQLSTPALAFSALAAY